MPARPLLPLTDRFAREVPDAAVAWAGARAPAASVVWLNRPLADELGLDADRLAGDEGAAVLSGSDSPAGATPVAQAYAGHQFGGFSPLLGDGRALLLGELTGPEPAPAQAGGVAHDLHLKGSGRTPFSRGGDGKAVLGPVLRECVVGEAMHALGVPTTRALAATLTGETVWRDGPAPGAVLARVAASHLRIGSFEFAAARGDLDLLARLADHAISRHDPDLVGREGRYLAFFAAVADRQARLVAQWMAVGFVHGVMNTDNVAVSGETLDYGPCAFLDAYDPGAVFSSIDTGGRYAFGNQPAILVWNLARFAEALLPLVAGDDPDAAVRAATDVLDAVTPAYEAAYLDAMCAKLGLVGDAPDDVAGDASLVDDWLALLARTHADYTASMRALSSAARGDVAPLAALVAGDAGTSAALDAWLVRWRDRLAGQPGGASDAADRMDRTNPLYIPRNHAVEAALAAATGDGAEAGDLGPFLDLVERVRRPFDAAPGFEWLAAPPPPGTPRTVTFCGT